MSSTQIPHRSRLSNPYRRFLAQILAMFSIGLIVGAVALFAQYRVAYEQQRERLSEVAQSQARLIEESTL
ncbi:hypothetical protein ACFL3S_08145 [Gemmatimonadota bacterium]